MMAESSTYTALVGGLPHGKSPMQLEDFRSVVHHHAANGGEGDAQRVWLDLTNGQSLTLTFEKLKDDILGETCTMRVRRSRELDECELDDPSQCRDVGCIAVRWNLRTSEGVLIDLFKATKGKRSGCDISSADDPSVKWGRLMLRVVDDIASMLRCRHVYLADESSVSIRMIDLRTRRPHSRAVMLKYLKPLLDGVAYYEPHGYYSVSKRLYYGFNKGEKVEHHEDDEDERRDEDAAARLAAAAELTGFNAVRTAPFLGGQLASAISTICNDVCDNADERSNPGVRLSDTEEETHRQSEATVKERLQATLIHRFAKAVGAAQDATLGRGDNEQEETKMADAFGEAVRAAPAIEPIPGHVPSYRDLEDFTSAHIEALDDEVLAARDFGDMMRILSARSRHVVADDDDAQGLLAGALMVELMFEFYAAFHRRKGVPLKRKDYFHHYNEGEVDVARTSTSGVRIDEHGVITVNADVPHVPIIRKVYWLDGDWDGEDEMEE